MVLEQENIHVGCPNLLIELLVCFRFTVHTSVYGRLFVCQFHGMCTE
jgi:hypothetical protein